MRKDNDASGSSGFETQQGLLEKGRGIWATEVETPHY
jgi:hypothetical protein